MPRTRLDALLTERGLFDSRSRAAASILAGEVRIDGQPARKPGQMVVPEARIALEERPRFVSRGGVKLANALDELGLGVRARRCIDVGASTGGFTDCLLQRGAGAVICVDVAYGELHWGIRNDPRVTVLERTNARHLDPARLPYAPDLAVVDVSFISLAKVLPAVVGASAEEADVLALVKPQFEVGRDRVGKGGVVRSAADRRAALVSAGESARACGLRVRAYVSSGLPGPKGNRESFMWCDRVPAGAEDLEALAAKVEP